MIQFSHSIALYQQVVFWACLLPLFNLMLKVVTKDLGANPIEAITHETGWWALTYLLATLSITPARIILKKPFLIVFRRMFGLFAFFYSILHFLVWVFIDQFLDWSSMILDVIERPFITVGFLAFIFMWPLAITSNRKSRFKLGEAKWKGIHRLVYLVGVLAVIHYWWLVKKDVFEPLVFAIILSLLLLSRVSFFLKFFSQRGEKDT